MRLTPGRYTLAVSTGEGPAGVHRNGHGNEVTVDIDGGRVDFTVTDDEPVFYWWRGPAERPGVRLLGISSGDGRVLVGTEDRWQTGTTG